jgi:hypothetical protein
MTIGGRKKRRQRIPDGVVVNGGESEGRIVVGWQRERIGVNKVVEGTTLVEAMNLPTVMSFEDVEEFVEEVLYFDDRLIREWRQANFHGIRIRAHRFTWMPHGAA